MERPKARLTIDQHQRAINASIWIDASPHEWPTIKEIPLLCNCILDQTEMVDFLQRTIAAIRAELAAARLEIEALRVKPWQEQIEGQSAVISRLRYEKGVAEAEAAELRAHVERMRKALDGPQVNNVLGLIEDCSYAFVWSAALAFMEFRTGILAATPAQSLAKCKADAMREIANLIRQTTPSEPWPERGDWKQGRVYAIEQIESEAERLQEEAANG